MRGVLLSLVCAAGLLALTPTKSIASFTTTAHAAVSSPAPVFAQQQAEKKLDININTSTNSGGGYRWYRNPMWIAILAIGGVVLLMLIVMAARGGSNSGAGGTTIVK
jgi:hypothetical protein